MMQLNWAAIAAIWKCTNRIRSVCVCVCVRMTETPPASQPAIELCAPIWRGILIIVKRMPGVHCYNLKNCCRLNQRNYEED